MSSEFSCWLCYVKLLVCEPDTNSCRWNLVYCSFPAKLYSDLLGFQNEHLKIIAIFKFHPMNSCAIAEIDEPEQLKASIKVLIVGDNLLNFGIPAKTFMRKSTLVAYYGFDVETSMQIAANKQVDIIIVNTAYEGKYNDKQVNGVEIAKMLKFNPDTAQNPVILKLGGQVMVGDRERYLNESGADNAIRLDPGSIDPLIEKIKQTLSANNSHQNITINSKNKVSYYPPVTIQKEKKSAVDLELLAYRIYLVIVLSSYSVYFLRNFLQARIDSFIDFIREFLQKYNPFKKNHD
jgi:two-component system, cell cycle response regulator DivK